MGKLVAAIANNQYGFNMERISIRVRNLLSAMVYRKGLKLSSKSAAKRSPAEVVNFISIDASKVSYAFYYLNYSFLGPLIVIGLL